MGHSWDIFATGKGQLSTSEVGLLVGTGGELIRQAEQVPLRCEQ